MLKYMPMLFFYVFIFCLDLYLFQGIKTLTTSFESENARKITHWVFWIVNIAFMLIIALAFTTFDREKGFKTYQILGFNTLVLLMIPKLVFAFVLLGQDAFRLFGTAGNYALGTVKCASPAPRMQRCRFYVRLCSPPMR